MVSGVLVETNWNVSRVSVFNEMRTLTIDRENGADDSGQRLGDAVQTLDKGFVDAGNGGHFKQRLFGLDLLPLFEQNQSDRINQRDF